MANFELDLEKLSGKLADKDYATRMYAALCNNEFVNEDEAPTWWEDALRDIEVKHNRRTWWKKIIIKVVSAIRHPFARLGYKLEVRPKVYSGTTYQTKYMTSREPFSTINHFLLGIEMKFWDFCPSPDWIYSCSWRYAGGMIAEIRDVGEDYLDFYCSGNESIVDDEIREDLEKIGWFVADKE